MKTRLMVAGFLLATVATLAAAPEKPKIELLRGDSMVADGKTTVARGSASAVFGDLQISAAEIAFVHETGVLKCVGGVTLKSTDRTVTATEATIETMSGKPVVLGKNVRIVLPPRM